MYKKCQQVGIDQQSLPGRAIGQARTRQCGASRSPRRMSIELCPCLELGAKRDLAGTRAAEVGRAITCAGAYDA